MAHQFVKVFVQSTNLCSNLKHKPADWTSQPQVYATFFYQVDAEIYADSLKAEHPTWVITVSKKRPSKESSRIANKFLKLRLNKE